MTTKKNKSGNHPTRQELPAHLLASETDYRLQAETMHLQKRGKDKAVIGYEQSNQLDVDPARYFAWAHDAEKRILYLRFREEQYREFLNAEFHGRYLLSLESVLTLKGEQN